MYRFNHTSSSFKCYVYLNLPLPQVPVYRDRHDRRQTALAYAIAGTQPDAPPLVLRLMNDITVDIAVDVVRTTVRADAVQRRAHTAHPCCIGRIVCIYLRFLYMLASIYLYCVSRKPCDVRQRGKQHQRVDLGLRHHDGRCLYRISLYSRLPASRTDKPAQGETGYTYYYIRKELHRSAYSVFASKHGHSLMRSQLSTMPLPFVSGLMSLCPNISALG